MKAKKLLALVLTLCLAFSCVAVVPFTVSADEPASTATATTSAVWIGRSQRFASSNQYDVRSNVLIPLSTTNIGGVDRKGTSVTLRFTCTAKMLSGTKPVVGWIRYRSWTDENGGSKTFQTEPSWAKNSASTYDATTGLFTCTITADIPSTISSQNGSWGILTVGNSNLNNNYHADTDWSQEFIMSNPQLYLVEDNETVGSNLVPSFANHGCGLYSYRGSGTEKLATGSGSNAHNNYMLAPCGVWNRDCFDEDYVQYITVADDYVTANHTYVKHAETDTTREYYTCADFAEGTYFKKVSEVNDVYAKITDINKKSFIIGNNLGVSNKVVSNIFVPINTHKYFVYESIWNGARESDGNFMIELTANVKQLSGNETPIISVFYSQDGSSGGDIGLPRPSTTRGYGGSGSKKFDNQTYSYNPTTGELKALVAVEKGVYKEISKNNGACYYIGIGNAEHDWNPGEYSETAFNTRFIISNIKFKVYDSLEMTNVLDQNDAPEMVAENIDTDTSHVYLDGAEKMNGTIDVDVSKIPVKTYGAEGAVQTVYNVNSSTCLNQGHSLTHHVANATNNTREYWSCSTCGKQYLDQFGSVIADTIYETRKMIAVKASGSRPGNAYVTFNQAASAGTHYYKFECDMRIFGDDVPTVSTVMGSWWGGNNAQATDGSWTNNSSEPNASGLYTSYDADTNKFVSVFKIDKPNNASNQRSYYNSLTGNYAAFLLGNGAHIGANGYTDTKYFSSFIFGNPSIVEVEQVSGNWQEVANAENLCPSISDKTLNFGTAYTGETKAVYNTENTMYRNNNILSAPAGKWNVDGSRSWVTSMDIPEETFFTQQQGFAAKMFRLGGAGSNYNGISTQLFLTPGQEYQLDIDYREFGSPARIAVQISDGGEYKGIVYTETEGRVLATTTDDNVDGAHKSIRFTVPSTANTDSGDGNFRLYLGQESAQWTTRCTTTVYYANASVCAVNDGEADGANLLMNGSFDFGSTGDITDQNKAVKLFGWEIENALTYAKHDLMTIPEGFFEGDIGESEYAVKFNAHHWSYIRTEADLAPNSVYELSFNYRGTDDDINFGIDNMSNRMSIQLISNHSDGKYKKTYRITTTENLTYYSGGDCNTKFQFQCPASSDGNEYYINNIQLHKVVNNKLVGVNMLGDRNAIYTDATYSGDTSFTLPKNVTNRSTISDFGHGFYATQDNTTGSVVKVSEHFFDYYAPADRLAAMANVLLNKEMSYNPYTDTTSLYYNPDKDANNVTNILDFVKVKKDIANMGDEGGAGAEATVLKSKILNAANTNVSGKTVYYVDPVSGNDSAAGTSSSTALKTLAKAITKVGSNGSNKAIVLKRGTVTRIPVGADDGYILPGGTTLGAYGEGAKPIILGSAKNYAGSSNWTNVSGNIWKCTVTANHDINTPGTVFFFNSASETSKTPDLVGRVIKMTGDSEGTRFANYSALEQEGDVYYQTSSFKTSDTVYVYSEGNPGSKYGRIEIGEKETVLAAGGDNVIIDNIAVLFAGGHGIAASGRTGTSIVNCEVAYVGGTPNINGDNVNETMGNGIQLGQGGTNETISSCYVHDCYDAGITFQSWSGTTTFSGISFVNNLLENNFYNIEFFTTSTGTLSNININGNIMRFGGECWSYTQRADTKLRAANICAGAGSYYTNTSNLKIQNNIFDCTMCQQILWYWGGVVDSDTHVGTTISGNTYYQKYGSLDGRVNRFGKVSNTTYDYANSTATLAASIAKMDSAPAKVEWVNRIDKF